MDLTFGPLKFEFFHSDNAKYGSEWNGLRLNDDYHRLYFISEGQAETIYNGIRQPLKSGHIYLFPTTRSFDYSCQSGHLYLLNVCFKLSFPGDVDALSLYPYISDLIAEDPAKVCASMADIGAKLKNLEFSDQMHIRGLMLELLSPHFKIQMTDEFRRRQHTIERFKPVLNHINTNINRRISVTQLSTLANMSRSYFAKKFTETFYMSTQDYIRKHRVEQVKRILRTTSRPLSLLAEEFGYSSAPHMTREFKLHTGYSPSEYRNLDVFFD